jgi:hypothetical protein
MILPTSRSPSAPQLRLWLTRFRFCPLFLYFDTWVLVDISQVIEAVGSDRSRWQDRDLYLSLLSTMEGPMPLLRYLNLAMAADSDYPTPLPKLYFATRFCYARLFSIIWLRGRLYCHGRN